MQQQILVIDDSKPVHMLVKALLSDVQVQIHSATDAAYGLVLAASLRPDLILLDIDLPSMNGFEACKRLKSDRATADLPVMFLTSLSKVEEKVRGLELGAVDYVTKPFNQAELLARVRSSLHTSRLIHLLEDKALIDPLTGLGNRAMFDQRMDAEVARRLRFQNGLSCIVLDIDNFKQINDRFGHQFGDEVLRLVGQVVSDACRAEDTGCRYGGDEFVVIAPHSTGTTTTVLAQRMRNAISKLCFPQQDDPVQITCSIGIADSLDPYDRSMFQRADDAMYSAKKSGGNQIAMGGLAPEQRAVAA